MRQLQKAKSKTSSPIPVLRRSTRLREGHGAFQFMSLPAELRLQIYQLILVSYRDADRDSDKYLLKCDQHKMTIFIGDLDSTSHRRQESQDCAIATAILRTCRQVHQEALPILYKDNIIYSKACDDLLSLKLLCGETNFQTIRSLQVCITGSDNDKWMKFPKTCTQSMPSLRYLSILFMAPYSAPRDKNWLQPGYCGLGSNVEFARGLLNIKGLSHLVLGGHFAKNWPKYFEDKLHCRVITVVEDWMPSYLREQASDDDVARKEKEMSRGFYTMFRQWFYDYQKCTEDLWP